MGLCSDSPDYSGQNDAARSNANSQREYLDWYQSQVARSQGMRDQGADMASQQARQNLANMSTLQNQGTQDIGDYNTTYRPMMLKLAEEAANYDTADRRAQAANQTASTISQNFGAQDAALQRDLQRSGTNMSSAGALMMRQNSALAQAKAQAGGQTMARQNVENMGYARRADAVNMGATLNQRGQQSINASMQAGNNSIQNMSAAASMQNGANNGNIGQAYAQYGNSMQSLSGVYGQQANAQAQAQQQDNAAVAGMATAAIMAFSDKNMKTGVKKVKDEAVLKEIRKTPVSEWNYKGDAARHTGPMAQDVNASMGEAAAPGGRMIDLITMNGKMLAAVRALDKKVSSLEGA